MVLENQAKIQMIDKKAGQKEQMALPSLPQIDVTKFKGQEMPLIERFMDVSLVEKDVLESKHARHHLGLGMPEARAI
jgi:hypothetical protein